MPLFMLKDYLKLKNEFNSKVWVNGLETEFGTFYQFRKSQIELEAWSIRVLRVSMTTYIKFCISTFRISQQLTLVNILSTRAQMKIQKAWLALEHWILSRRNFHLIPKAFECILGPLVKITEFWSLKVGPIFGYNDFVWEFWACFSFPISNLGWLRRLFVCFGFRMSFGAPLKKLN